MYDIFCLNFLTVTLRLFQFSILGNDRVLPHDLVQDISPPFCTSGPCNFLIVLYGCNIRVRFGILDFHKLALPSITLRLI